LITLTERSSTSRSLITFSLLALVLLSAAAPAQDKSPFVVELKNVLGTWKGKADPELPDRIIKLQLDDGKITGSMRVFEVINNGDGPKVSNDRYLPLSDITLKDNTLSFKIKLEDGRAIERKLKFTNDTEAVYEDVRRIVINGDAKTETVNVKMVKEK
jgi:hypothetical protein